MHGAFFKSIITSMALSAVLTACADPPRRVLTPSGSEIQLPACKDYVSKFSDVSIRADILNKYQGELKLSAGNKTTLETLQQDYGMQARQLCENAPLYINSGNEQQYFCRDERLSNSLTQLRTLNRVLEGIHDIGEAKSQAENIRTLTDDFIKRFFTQFDKPCSEPPKPLSLQEIRSEVKDAFREVMAEYGIRQPSAPGPNLPQQEMARELTEVRQELTSLSEKVEKEYAEGDRYYKKQNFDTAIRHFTNAVDLATGIPSLYLALGKSYSSSHQYNDAVATYDRGLKVVKQTEKVYVNLLASRGSAKESLGYHQEAIDDLSRAIKLSPDHANAYYNRGIAKAELKDFAGAVADYTESIKLSPEDDDAYFNRGSAKYKMNDLQGAIADYTESIKLGPDHDDTYYNRGIAKYELKDFAGAVADSTAAIKIKPDHVHAYFNRGLAKGQLKDLPDAIADFTESIKLGPDHADAYFNRGVAKAQLKDLPGAVADYTEAIKLDQKDARAYYNRGVAKILLNDFSGAITDSTATIKLIPDHADAYYNRGVAKAQLKDFLGAIADYTAAINLGPNLDDAYEARGSAHTALRNEKEATDDFGRAMELRLKLSQASALH